MAKRKYRRKGQRLSVWEELDWSMQPDTTREISAVILIILGIIIFLGMFGFAGSFGHFFIRLATDLWGILGFLIPFIFLAYGVALLMPSRFQVKPASVIGVIFTLIFLPALIHPLGGSIGSGIRALFQALVGFYASLILLFGLTIVSLLITFNTSIKSLWSKFNPSEGEQPIHVNEPSRASVFQALQSRENRAISSPTYQTNGKPWNFPDLRQ